MGLHRLRLYRGDAHDTFPTARCQPAAYRQFGDGGVVQRAGPRGHRGHPFPGSRAMPGVPGRNRTGRRERLTRHGQPRRQPPCPACAQHRDRKQSPGPGGPSPAAADCDGIGHHRRAVGDELLAVRRAFVNETRRRCSVISGPSSTHNSSSRDKNSCSDVFGYRAVRCSTSIS